MRRPRNLKPARGEEDGFTIVELAVTVVVTALLFAVIPNLMQAAADASSYSQGTAAGSSQDTSAVLNLASQVESASQICLPTEMTTAGPTVSSGFAIRVLSSAFGKSLWDQWMLNTSIHVLEEQQWPTNWVVGNAVPPWVQVAKWIMNSSTVPFALPTVATGSPQTLSIDLQVNEQYQNRSQLDEFKASIAAFDTPYSSSPPVVCSTAATQEGWT